MKRNSLGNMAGRLLKILMLAAVCMCAVGVSAGLSGCRGSHGNIAGETENDGDRLSIVATLFPQYDFARQIAGEYADVTLLLPPGMESHSYDLRPSDMIMIRESDMFIYTGQYMETWAQTIIDSLDDSVMVVDVSEGITLDKETDYFVDEHVHDETEEHDYDGDDAGDEHDNVDGDDAGDGHEHGAEYEEAVHEGEHEHTGHQHEYDPHIWTDPVYAVQMVKNIAEALCTGDPEHADEYAARAEEYIERLGELDAAFRKLGGQAEHNTIFFGGRFAMSYFVKEYGFDCVAAYHDCSAESEPSISSVMRLIDEIRESGAEAVYYEELADPKVARTIAEETGAKLLLLHSAHNVSKEDFDKGVTYLDIMWQNVENLKEGLN